MIVTRDRIQTVLDVDKSVCELRMDGMPPAFSGEQFVAVHEGEWRADSGDYDLAERYGVEVTITRKFGRIPDDRIGTELIAKETTGLIAIIRQIIPAIHMDYANIMNAANALITEVAGSTANGFIEPLRFIRVNPTEPKGHGWFHAKMPMTDTESWTYSGVARTIVFGDALVQQTISSAI